MPDTIYQITSSDNQNNNNYNDTSVIQIGNCEKILRAKYNFSDDDKIIIFKIDVKEEEGSAAPGLVGEGHKITYTFTAEKSGTNELVFTYRRPWSGGEEAYSVEYDIVIDEDKNIKCLDRRIIDKDSEAEISEIPYPFFYTENN